MAERKRDALVDALRAARVDYEAERVWHRFLLDAYTGCGGFAGKVKPPANGYLGWAAEVYASSTAGSITRESEAGDTYLDRFPREDGAKFQRRMDVAHYVNYTGPICDLYSSYLSSQPATRQGHEGRADLAAWLRNADGRGTSWDELRDETIVQRALELGWCPVMFDKDAAPEGVAITSRAQEHSLNLGVRAIPLFPANLPQWECDDAGALLWAKVRLDYCEKPDPLGGEIRYEKYLIWTRTDVSEYRITTSAEGDESATVVRDKVPHSFGAVPVIVFRAGKAPDDSIRGISIVGAVAVENRRHFNLLSELDEHLRSTVFALLQVPIPSGTQAPNELLTGAGNAVPVPADASQPYKFVSPEASVADTYETRLKSSEREMYRIANAPYESDSGAAQSGVSRAYQFDGTNKRLVKIAKGSASAEQRALQLVSVMLGGSQQDAASLLVTPPAEFRVDDLSVDLDNLIKAVSIRGMAATAKKLMVLRSVHKMLPNMSASDRQAVAVELEATCAAELQVPAVAFGGGAQTPEPPTTDPSASGAGDEGDPTLTQKAA